MKINFLPWILDKSHIGNHHVNSIFFPGGRRWLVFSHACAPNVTLNSLK